MSRVLRGDLQNPDFSDEKGTAEIGGSVYLSYLFIHHRLFLSWRELSFRRTDVSLKKRGTVTQNELPI
jgi:hypothetical protein